MQTTTSAELSPCGRYRYVLSRGWGQGNLMNFVMCNPSTADAEVDDPTIRKCVGFAKKFGFDGIQVMNLFAFRATDPKELGQLGIDPIGYPENDKYLRTLRGDVCLAWGGIGKKLRHHPGRPVAVEVLLRNNGCRLLTLGMTKSHAPRHPLYLPYTTELQDF